MFSRTVYVSVFLRAKLALITSSNRLLLLLGSCESYHFRLPREKGGGGTEVAGTENSSKLKFSQTLDSKGSELLNVRD